jgi:hypothetical protein
MGAALLADTHSRNTSVIQYVKHILETFSNIFLMIINIRLRGNQDI